MLNDMRDVKNELASRALAVAEHLLPGGKAHGGEYECGDLTGGPGKSLKVRLAGDKAGVWSDFAAGQSGDLIDLWRLSRNLSHLEAVREAVEWLGMEYRFRAYNTGKTFNRPSPAGEDLESNRAVADYLIRGRGLTREAVALYRVQASDRSEMVFPSYRDKALIAQKYIGVTRTEEGKKIVRVDAGCEPCLFGWQAIDPAAKEVTICEGEIDALSLWILGYPALSVPFGGGAGAKQDWIEYEWDRLDQFETIYVCMDADEPGRIAARAISERLGAHRCRIVNLPLKDANDCLIAGLDVEEYFATAQNLDPAELKNARAYKSAAVDILLGKSIETKGPGLPWGKALGTLEFRPGEVTIWSGINGHGKSMMLGQVLIHGAKITSQRACVASLEMRPPRTMARMVRQAAGMREPSTPYIDRIFDWFAEWLWLFDLVGTAKTERLLDVFTYARRRYNVGTFVIDSLAKCGIAEDDYNGQKRFVEQLCDFANAHNVHVHLVTHSRKKENEASPTGKMDVKGTGAITDMAFNNLVVWRNKRKEEAERRGEACDPGAVDALLICDKQRNGEWEGRVGLFFHQDSFQYLETDSGAPYRYVEYSEAWA